MATTKDRIKALDRAKRDTDRVTDHVLEDLWVAPARQHGPSPAPAPAPRVPAWRRLRLGGRMSPAWALTIALGWVAAVVVVQITLPPPPPTNPAAEPFFAVALNMIWNLAFFGALAGAAVRQRWGLAASAVGAVIGFSLAVACPVSGHHETVGLWWGAQLAAFGGLSALSIAGLRRGRA
jgi:hypothetical protein